MKFIDEALITVTSGNGGRGCVSFRRERFIPKGGPDGGDGGKGGDVIITASAKKRTLYPFRFKKRFAAKNGQPGQGSQKTGKSGEDLIIEVPLGTIITDALTGEVLRDLVNPGEKFVAAKGGRGGQGNMRFKSSTNKAPRFAQPGEPGTSLELKLELKLLADVGIMGFPNAGKSTLISAISSAKPKIADYPFTTLTPNLGVVSTGFGEPFVVADVPGLIKGAHTGAGLGTRFLRHLERTKILVHLIDVMAIDPDDPLSGYNAINRELALHSKNLAQKPQLVVLNKMDIPGSDVGEEFFKMAAGKMDYLTISAYTGMGLEKLKSKIIRLLDKFNEYQT